MVIVEELSGYGEVTNQQQQLGLSQLIQDLIKYGINRYKYQLAMKMAQPACKRDPQNCPHYIASAFKALGLPIPQSVAMQLSQQTGQAQTQIYQQLPTQTHKDKTDYFSGVLILGGAVLGGVFLAYYLSNRG